jgi:chaperonin GroEL
MAVQIKYGKEAREALLEGARKLNQAVSVTMGPAGRTVIFRHGNMLVPTKDGVTVAREINLPDPFESIGADLIKAAAGQCVDQAGDGTTAATLLAYSIFEAGCQAIDSGAEPTQLVRGIERACRAIVGEYDPEQKKFSGGILEKFSVPTTPELAFQAARISANGDEKIARVVSDAVLQCGVEGALTIGDSYSTEHVLERLDGMQVRSGMVHPYFVTDPQRNRAVYDDVTVLLVNRRISTANEATNIMKAAIGAAQADTRAVSILILCDDIDPEALIHIVNNKVRPDSSAIPIVVVRTPLWADARRDLLEDLSVITGGKVIDSPRGKAYEDLRRADFGYAKRVVVDHSRTLITTDPSDFERSAKLEPHIARIKAVIADEASDARQVDAAKTRLAALTGGVAVIKVGGTSANDITEIKFRVEDAIHATRAAVSDGVVPGGGSALLFASLTYSIAKPEPGDFPRKYVSLDDDSMPELSDVDRGVSLLLSILVEPLKQIAANAGYKGDEVANKVAEDVLDHGYTNGFDASSGTFPKDMIAAGIVDPLRVVRAALNAATSAAATTLLKCEAVIAHDPVSDTITRR